MDDNLLWTENKPTKPGFYFFRFWAWNSPGPVSVRVIEVRTVDGELWAFSGRNEDRLDEFAELHPVTPVRCEYAGPISEPTE